MRRVQGSVRGWLQDSKVSYLNFSYGSENINQKQKKLRREIKNAETITPENALLLAAMHVSVRVAALLSGRVNAMDGVDDTNVELTQLLGPAVTFPLKLIDLEAQHVPL